LTAKRWLVARGALTRLRGKSSMCGRFERRRKEKRERMHLAGELADRVIGAVSRAPSTHHIVPNMKLLSFEGFNLVYGVWDRNEDAFLPLASYRVVAQYAIVAFVESESCSLPFEEPSILKLDWETLPAGLDPST
ncbi:hypothetical protein FOZ62_020644, partial [Perkinsus olseni]